MQIKVEKVVYPGKSLGRGADGIAVFAEGALPGETIEVEIIKNKKTFKEARFVSVIEPSPQRIMPRCLSCGQCGGCSFQHTSYENQIALKKAYTNELLLPAGISVSSIIKSPEQWGYRNKMEFSFSQNDSVVIAGLHKKNEFNRYVSVPPCHIADPSMMDALEIILSFVRSSALPAYNKWTRDGFYRHLVFRKAKNTGHLLINIVTNSVRDITPAFFLPLVDALKDKAASIFWSKNGSVSDTVASDELVLLYGKDMIDEDLHVKGRTFSFTISPFSFFQTNTLGAEKLYEAVIDAVEWNKEDTVLDLYSGTGTIALVLAEYVKEVRGVEIVADAVKNANANKERNGVQNAVFETGSVEKWISGGSAPSFNSMVIDPPRAGLSPKALNFIKEIRPKKLVYVSCNPSTLARDLKYLIDDAGYSAQAAKCIDMFPHTYHIETVVPLTLR